MDGRRAAAVLAGELWQHSKASVLILDVSDKSPSEFNVSYLYDVLDPGTGVSGSQKAVLMVLNHTPGEFGEQLSQHGYLGHAVAQRTLQRNRPVWLDFADLPMGTDDKKPWVQRMARIATRSRHSQCPEWRI